MKRKCNTLGDFNNTELGFLRAFNSAHNKRVKKYPDLFLYQGDEVFHYTDLAGLIGILSNKGFWLSDVCFLNDAEEIQNGVDLTSSLIRKLLEKKRYKIFQKVFEETLKKLKESSLVGNHYISSFSLTSDSLEQWRAYAQNGSGICIGFNVKEKTKYNHFTLMPHYYLQKVIYKNSQKNWILLTVIRKYFSEFQKDIRNGITIDIDDYVNSLAQSLSSVFINFKNTAFQSEKEVRIVQSSDG